MFVAQTQQPAVGMTQGSGTRYTVATLASMMRSRQLAEIVVDNLDLTSHWSDLSRTEAVRKLHNGISVSANDRDGIITVSLRDPDPALARDIVAAYVTQFEEMANELNVTEADRVVAFARERHGRRGNAADGRRGGAAPIQGAVRHRRLQPADGDAGLGSRDAFRPHSQPDGGTRRASART